MLNSGYIIDKITKIFRNLGYRTYKFNENLFLAKGPISIVSGKSKTIQLTILFLKGAAERADQQQKTGLWSELNSAYFLLKPQ